MDLALDLLLIWYPVLLCVLLWGVFFSIGRWKLRTLTVQREQPFAGPSNTITVARRLDTTALLRSYKVLVDGKVVGEIGPGKVKHFELSAGEHAIAVKVDWCRSEPLKIIKSAQDNVFVWCGATHNDWRCMFTPFTRPSKYVYVQPEV